MVLCINKFCNPDTRDSIVLPVWFTLSKCGESCYVHVKPSWICRHQKMCDTDVQGFAYANMIIIIFFK